MPQAGTYSGTLHLLKAAEALDGATSDGRKLIEKMKSIPKDDPLFGKGEVRADGRAIHSVYLFEAKAPAVAHRGDGDTATVKRRSTTI